MRCGYGKAVYSLARVGGPDLCLGSKDGCQGVFCQCMVQGGVEDLSDKSRNIFDGGGSVGGVVMGWR